jgi:polyphosphate glucokinase
MDVLGIDIGGSAIKSARVNVIEGKIASEVFQLPTPRPATPEQFLEAFDCILKHFNSPKALGIGFPGVVEHNTIYTAPNLDAGWQGLNLGTYLKEHFGLSASILNDADAAGLAEMTWGAGKGYQEPTLVLTLGTGIGSAFFHRGLLCPNFELGHLEMYGKEAEALASAQTKAAEKLSWEAWAKRLDAYLVYVHSLFWPQRFILGGGISANASYFLPLLSLKNKIYIANLLNSAGFMGAALAASAHGSLGATS